MILRALAWCLAAILAIAVGWSWLRAKAEPPTPVAPGSESQLVEGTAEDGLALPATSDWGGVDTLRHEVRLEPQKELLPPQSTQPMVTERFHVLDGITRERIGGARVLWCYRGEIREFEHSHGLPNGDYARTLAQIGRVVHADDQGLVVLQVRMGAVVLAAAQHGELSGEVEFVARPSPGPANSLADLPFELLLFPHRTLEIQVVDAAGMPHADVEVCLRTVGAQSEFVTLDTSETGPRVATDVCEVWRGVTAGKLGLVRIQDPDARLYAYYDAQRAGRAPRLYADLTLPSHPPAAVLIDPRMWPRVPVQLVLPELGSLTVVVLDATGQPTSERAKVYVDAAQPFDRTSARIGERELENGRSSITGVPLGLPLAVEVSFYGRRDAIQRQIDGPTAAQPVVEVVLVESRPTPVLVGRLVDGSGAPITGASVSLRFQSRDRSGDVLSFGSWLFVTQAGEFEVQLATRLYDHGSVSLRFDCNNLRATRELRHELTRLRIDLGDVQLTLDGGEVGR